MLDGRYGNLLLGCATAALLTAGCGSADDVGARAATPTAPTAPPAAPTTNPSVDRDRVDVSTTDEDAPSRTRPTLAGACSSPERGPRCDADPQTFTGFGAASIVTSFELLGEQSCCADFDDDGEMDNALGEGLATIGQLDRLNAELGESLLSGAQTIVFEVDDLDSILNDVDVELHVWNGNVLAAGSPTNGPYDIQIDRASIDEGVAPLFSFDDARIDDGILRATKGAMALEASFHGVWLRPEVRGLELTAELVTDDATQGIQLRHGEVAGHIALDVIYDELNGVAESCECLGLDGPLLRTGASEMSCGAPDAAACEAAERPECAQLVEVCPLMETVAKNLVDVDTDADGIADAISLGALFGAEPAVISGVAPTN